ncbi:MAG: hypothetical protein KatS3mg003_1841 [Candidatus Nitrosocaldaceae archaeon]|nr:MAG: hypothetical protein KatS3mg003_1841 [Candidatus Nitrosocaldaceae archaeon]
MSKDISNQINRSIRPAKTKKGGEITFYQRPLHYHTKDLEKVDILKNLFRESLGNKPILIVSDKELYVVKQSLENIIKRTNIDPHEEIIQKIRHLEEKLRYIEVRLEELEFNRDTKKIENGDITRIEKYIYKLFVSTPFIKHVGFYPTQEGLQLFIIYDTDDEAAGFEIITKKILKLEEAFPGIYFEPLILRQKSFDKKIYNNVRWVITDVN